MWYGLGKISDETVKNIEENIGCDHILDSYDFFDNSNLKIEIVSFGDLNNSCYGLAIKESIIRTDQHKSVSFTPGADWDERLKKAAELIGWPIPKKGPRFWIAADYC